ncbi:lysoplasmalogenase [Denticeps clupeoides]|uniref:lysoplasmalogenase n=1 Tax=Denticeps clupeoides TaxID=299321 RepID=A0AAY4CF60_9TELE|nr:lysoplasmalogenase-like protein TMEM86A [Denticeps clupeoides]
MDILETHAYDRRQRRNMSCVLFLSLLPFFLLAAVYFYFWVPVQSPSVLAAASKCAPVLSLALLVLSYNGGPSLLGVAGGLLFSAGGDICLIWPELFLHGMASFSIAHLLYSASFLSEKYHSHSSSSIAFILYFILWTVGIGAYVYLLPFLQRQPDSAIVTPAAGVYGVLLTIMGTLAVRSHRPLTMLGGLAFQASDLILSLQHFGVTGHVEYGEEAVMAMYYLAQLLIAVGDVIVRTDQLDEFKKSKRS